MLLVKALLDRLHLRSTPAEPTFTATNGLAPRIAEPEADVNGDLGPSFVPGGRPELDDAAKPAVHLPVEIIELIIWYLYNDLGAYPLRACSLVQRSWLRPSRVYLFESVQFINKDGQSRPQEQYKSLASYMCQLRVVGNGMSSGTLRLLHEQLSILVPLVTHRFYRISVGGLMVHKQKDIDDFHSVINENAALARIVSQITELTVSRCSFYDISVYVGFLASFPNLRLLFSGENSMKYRSLSTSEILELPVVDRPGLITDIQWTTEIDSFKDFFVALSRTASVHTVSSISGRWQSVPYFQTLGHFMKASTSLQSLTVDIRGSNNYTGDIIFSYTSDIQLCSDSVITFNLRINSGQIPTAVKILTSLKTPQLRYARINIHIGSSSRLWQIKRDVFAGVDLSSYPLLESVIVDFIGSTDDSVEFTLSDQKTWLVEELSVLGGKHELRIHIPHARHLPPDDQIIIPGE